MKNKIIAGTILTSMLLVTTPVEAMGNAKVEFMARDNIKVGDTFTVSMSVTDIKDTYDGVVSMGGNLSFDSSMVEYVSSKGIETPYLFQMNEDYNYKIAGLDLTLDNGIRESLTVYEFTFKALKEGNTTITLENAKLTDSQDYINTIVLEKEININAKEEVTETPIIEKTKESISNKKITVSNKSKVEVETTDYEEQNAKVEILEKIAEKQESIERIQNIVNELVSKLTKLFR